ncbi:MAG: hydrogenase, partial [Pseudomonadota bacterium]
MSTSHISELRQPLVDGVKDLGQITRDVCDPLDAAPTTAWYLAFAASLCALSYGAVMVIHQIWTGIGAWGLNKTVGWSWDITNFVFWVGIGHAGTLISAI